MPRPFNPNNYYGWRKLVLTRDNYSCVLCGSKERLETHHIKSYTKFPALRYNLENGQTLCHFCHKKTDSFGGKGRINGLD